MTALNAPSTAASGWWPSTNAGPTRTSTRSPTRLARPISFTCMSSARAAATWSSVTPSMPSTSTQSSGTREPNATVARIAVFAAASRPADVLGRIGLGEAEPLRLGERVAVRAALLHRGEDEVRRAVDDPEHAVHVRDDERLAQHLDHGDRRAHRGLEAQLDAARGRRLEELGAAAGDELLVRRHDRAARAEQLEHVVAGRVDAAHHLRDDLDRRVVEDRREVVGEHARARARTPAPCAGSRTSARVTRSRCPVARSISSADSSSSRWTAAPTVP